MQLNPLFFSMKQYYSQLLPKELKGLILLKLSGQELIDTCSDVTSLFYDNIFKGPIFWKDKILMDFPINNTNWDKLKDRIVIDPETGNGTMQEIVGTKYDIFDDVEDYDLQWFYRVLHYYFSSIKKPEKNIYNDLYSLTLEVFQHAGKRPKNTKLIDELMKEAYAISWMLPCAQMDVLDYIYNKYPQYRKVILIGMLFTNPESVSKFSKRCKPTEMFSFEELGGIIRETLGDHIIGDETEEFTEILIKHMIPQDKPELNSN
jgi:hypothetical protein